MARSAATFTLTPELRRTSTVVVLGSIMSILDTTIVAVALATLGRDFHVSVTTIQWVATGYLLALAMVTPVTGWAVDRFGAKVIWMTSLSLFIIGSSLCGLAWSANSLIAFRILQGIGGGMLLPVGQSILARAAGPQRMGRVMSIIGVPMVMGPIMGPVIGGLIVSNYSWRWIFYINVPIGIVTLVFSQRWLPRFDSDERFPSAFDTLGFCLLSPGLAAIVYALSEVGVTGSYTGAPVLISFVLGIALMGGFILHALRVKFPLLELHPFKNRNFAIANVCIFVIGATLFGSMFLLPLYYQVARGQEAWVAGLLMAPQGIGAACIMRWAGSVTDRVGPRRVVPVGILLMAVATIPLAFVTILDQRGLARRHALRARAGPRALHDAGHGGGLLRPEPRGDPEGLHGHEHRAPDRRLRRHRALRGRAGAPDRGQPRRRRNEGRRERRDHRRHRQAAGGRRRPGGRGVRPHVLVVGGRHPHRLRPDTVPAEPRGNACAHGAGFGPAGCRRRGRRGCRRRVRAGGPRRRGDAGLSALTGPNRPVHRDNDPSRLAAVLAGAGFVAAEDEARELVEAAGDEPGVLHALVERRLAGEPLAWLTGRSSFDGIDVRVDPGVYVPRWQSITLAHRAAARLPEGGNAIDVCTGAGALAVALRQVQARCPRRRHRHRRARGGLRAGQRRRGLRR